MSEYEKLILHLQTEEFEAAVQYKEESKLTPDLLPPVTKIDRIQTIWEKMFPRLATRCARRVYISNWPPPAPTETLIRPAG
ncbi:MAG: hypothetical protein ACLR6J_07705 [Parabacteroides merdae]